jgi:hypothetical protein
MFGIVDMLVVVITLDWYIETITNIKTSGRMAKGV